MRLWSPKRLSHQPMASSITEMRVYMDCDGCRDKVQKTLEKLKGVDEVNIDMEQQKVTVTGWADQKKVLKAVRKTGKRAEIWRLPYNPATRSFSHHHYSQQQCGGGGGGTGYVQAPAASSYNYYKHGCDGDEFVTPGYYSNAANSGIIGGKTGEVFSDDNPQGCSIM